MIPLILAQAISQLPSVIAALPAPPTKLGLDWSVIIPALGGVAGLLYGQYLTYKKSRDNGEKSDAVIKTAAQQTTQLVRIETLVDGRYGEVLQELADVKRLLAKITGLPADERKAELAQLKADEQQARVTAAGGPSSGGLPPPPALGKPV